MLSIAWVLAACGQRGDLYLPTPAKTAVPPAAGAAGPAGSTMSGAPSAATPAARPAPQFIDLPGGTTLRYQLLGSGPRTLVLLNEMGATLESWDNVVDELAREQRVLRYDLRGFGGSANSRREARTSDEVGDLGGLLDALQIRGPVTFIGGGAGATVALQFAAAHPERAQAVLAMADKRGTPGAQAISEANLGDAWPRLQCPVWLVVAANPDAAGLVDPVRALASRIPGDRGHLEVLDTAQLTASESPGLLLPLLRRFLSQTAR